MPAEGAKPRVRHGESRDLLEKWEQVRCSMSWRAAQCAHSGHPLEMAGGVMPLLTILKAPAPRLQGVLSEVRS